MLTPLTAISPIDGRYQSKTAPLAPYFSEYGLIRYRLMVEVRWLASLSAHPDIESCPALNEKGMAHLETLLANFDDKAAQKVKTTEQTTNHDVKAVEYFLQDYCKKQPELKNHISFIHFGLTSEDVNNLAYALMIKNALHDVILPTIETLIQALKQLAKDHHATPMLSHTHGQPASPTTLGKEFANVVQRLERQYDDIKNIVILGKCNGAVGNFNAHVAAYPDIDWPAHSKTFIEDLGLSYNPFTTQIEPHDWIASLSNAVSRFNTISLDLSRDCWTYIAMGYFTQRKKEGEVGSSTMPHKVNPIDFENAEGNFGIANALFQFFANKLPISRMQRDLSDSTTCRNIGTAFAHSLIAFTSLLKGIDKLEVNTKAIHHHLKDQWVLLAEPIQTVMRAHGITDAYEQLKALSRGVTLTQQDVHTFIDGLALPDNEKSRLKTLTPETYIGLASKLALTI
jgi:adenylosuccinate lyase